VMIREEAMLVEDGRPLHLELELSRETYEAMIRPLVESTLESVSRALDDAHKRPADLDAILLVGGSTRTPLVSQLLVERIGLQPRQDVHPDLCVALGAGVLATRLAGAEVDRVLVDVSPYSFGPSHLGVHDGMLYPHCYRPIIQRNTPLPVTRTERYFTTHAHQTEVELEIYQGDDPDALKNDLVGGFRVEGLRAAEEDNEVLVRMNLDLDGILHVTAIEKATGLSKQITIDQALKSRTETEIAETRQRLQTLFGHRAPVTSDEEGETEIDAPVIAVGSVDGKRQEQAGVDETHPALDMVVRLRAIESRMHPDDAAEAAELSQRAEAALAGGDLQALQAASAAMQELLFFVEGR
ncbi:MAG: Hsp70 family protein, partial [Candidatus Xenobia bacterium]